MFYSKRHYQRVQNAGVGNVDTRTDAQRLADELSRYDELIARADAAGQTESAAMLRACRAQRSGEAS